MPAQPAEKTRWRGRLGEADFGCIGKDGGDEEFQPAPDFLQSGRIGPSCGVPGPQVARQSRRV
jgi:hypothetical protein